MKNSFSNSFFSKPNFVYFSIWLILLSVSLSAIATSATAKQVEQKPAVNLNQSAQTIGNNPVDGSFTDAHNPSIFINEEDTFTNSTGAAINIRAKDFNFYAKREGNPVTPLLVKVNGDNDFTILAIGKTYTSADYSLGANIVPFADLLPIISVAPGETVASGFMDSNPDGSGWGVGGNPIPAGANHSAGSGSDQDEVWLLSPSPLIEFGSGYNANADTPAASVGENILITNSGKSLNEYTQLLRSYSFGISFTTIDEPIVNNGSFENDSVGNNRTNITGWSVTSGSVDVLSGSSAANGSAADGSRFLDLANGTLEQTISGFTPNQTYVLRIDYQGNTSDGALKDAQVLVDGQALSQGLFGGDPPGIHSKEENDWIVCNGFEFTPATSTVTLKIDSSENGLNGLFIDNIRILSGSILQPPEHDYNALTVDADGWRPLVNGSFESPISTYTSDPENTGPDDNNPHLCGYSIPGWRITRENTDLINGWPNTPDGSKVIDPGGHGPGGIAQTISGLAPNSNYQLEFYAARHRFWGTTPMTTEVWANGQQKLVFTRTSSQTANDGFIREVVDLTSNSNGKITFEIFSTNIDLGGNNVLDNFRMRAVGVPATNTPTPTTVPTQTPIPAPDDWIFNNNSGSYVDGSNSQIQVTGTGTDWKATFKRKDGSTFGNANKVSFDFYVDNTNSQTVLSIAKVGGDYQRFGLFENGNGLYAQIFRPDQSPKTLNYQLLSASEFQANTWYSGSITVDDINGFMIQVERKDDPTVNGSHRETSGYLATGEQWRFVGFLFQNNVFLDNYIEE
ncbi:MAG: hypothetical protein AAF902_17050 [Chloroflexota bacterium]